jgi:hypothetical protein
VGKQLFASSKSGRAVVFRLDRERQTPMIRGIHGLFYSDKDKELRAFMRDKLGLPATDIGGGWLIFDFEIGDLGVHPVDHGATSGKHDISFFTDDLEGTVAELRGKGVKFDDEIEDHGYGYVIHLTMPGGVRVQIYEPKYPKKGLKTKASTKKKAAKKPAAKKKAAAKAPVKKKKAAKKR